MFAKYGISFIEAVQNPMGFFVLVVFIIEIFLGLGAKYFEKQRTYLVKSMIALIFCLVAIVAIMACFKPEALSGTDPELANIINDFKLKEDVINKILGDWIFETRFKKTDTQEDVLIKGYGTITKGKYSLYMNGKWLDKNGQPKGLWRAKQVFIDENGLTFIYEVPLNLGKAVLGIAQVEFNFSGDKIEEMRGNWGILGSKLYGEAKFLREEL